MTNVSTNEDLPSLYEQMVHQPGAMVLMMTKMSKRDILDFYKYVNSKSTEGIEYNSAALELEEEEVVQHYLEGTLTEEMLEEPKEPELTEKDIELIEETARFVAEKQKCRSSLVYKLYRKIVPYKRSRNR